MAASLVTRNTAFSAKTVRVSKASRASVKVYASAARPMWLPGGPVPSHLNGTLPADFGFDPLNLGKDPEALKWYVAAEVFHCRLAMTAVAGILFPALATKIGAIDIPQWYDAGKVSNETSGLPFGTNVVIMHILVGFVEVKRWQEIRKPGSQAEPGSFLGFETAFAGTGNPSYPGGPFDPLGLAKTTPEKLKDLQLREIKNGRLAMLAFLGFIAQWKATGKGPLDNLVDHVADPWHKTFADNGVSIPFL